MHGWIDVGAFSSSMPWRATGTSSRPTSAATRHRRFARVGRRLLVPGICRRSQRYSITSAQTRRCIWSVTVLAATSLRSTPAAARTRETAGLADGFRHPVHTTAKAAARHVEWLDAIKAGRDAVVLRNITTRRRPACRRTTRASPVTRTVARQAGLSRDDGRWHLRADPAHKLPISDGVRLDEVISIWQRVTAPDAGRWCQRSDAKAGRLFRRVSCPTRDGRTGSFASRLAAFHDIPFRRSSRAPGTYAASRSAGAGRSEERILRVNVRSRLQSGLPRPVTRRSHAANPACRAGLGPRHEAARTAACAYRAAGGRAPYCSPRCCSSLGAIRLQSANCSEGQLNEAEWSVLTQLRAPRVLAARRWRRLCTWPVRRCRRLFRNPLADSWPA